MTFLLPPPPPLDDPPRLSGAGRPRPFLFRSVSDYLRRRPDGRRPGSFGGEFSGPARPGFFLWAEVSGWS